MAVGERFLKFRCSGCGNCCKEPLLPLNHLDLARLSEHTGEAPLSIVKWVSKREIAMDNEPEAFVRLRQGKRVMVLGHRRGGCRYLQRDNRCGVYTARPTGCRVFPFDPEFSRTGRLKRLQLIQATDCLYSLDGHNDLEEIRDMRDRHEAEQAVYYESIAAWNREQAKRQRKAQQLGGARAFLSFLGIAAS